MREQFKGILLQLACVAGGGAWPFLVGGVICLNNSINDNLAKFAN